MSERFVSSIEAVSAPGNNNRWGIKLDGKWFNDFGAMPDFVDKDVVVKVKADYNEKYDSYDIKTIEPYDEEEEKRGQQNKGKDGVIQRQSAVKSACALYQGRDFDDDELKATIKEFETYIKHGHFSGDE